MSDAAWEGVDGLELGRFTLVRRLGVGGMGEVWAARDATLGREVALKVLLRGDANALRREATAMAQLRHPNILVVHDVVEVAGRVALVTELMRTNLRCWLVEPHGPTPAALVTGLLGVARGLAIAHRAGIVHRDVKPDNILVDASGVLKVADFGLAAATADAGIAGTPQYMAPEQLLGGTVDARADQFALSATTWEALCGALPFAIDSQPGLPSAPLRIAAITDRRFAIGTPRRISHGLGKVLRRGLAPDPEARFDDLATWIAAIERLRVRPHRARRIAIAIAIGAIASGAAVAIRHDTTSIHPPKLTERILFPSREPSLQLPARISRDGTWIVMGDRGHRAHVVDLVDESDHSVSMPAGVVPEAIAPCPRERCIIVLGHTGASVALYRIDLASGASQMFDASLPASSVAGLNMSRLEAFGDGALVLTEHAVLAIDPHGPARKIATSPPGETVVAMRASPSGDRIAVSFDTGIDDQRVELVTADGRPLATLAPPAGCHRIESVDWADAETLDVFAGCGQGHALYAVRLDVRGRATSTRFLGPMIDTTLAAWTSARGIEVVRFAEPAVEVGSLGGRFVPLPLAARRVGEVAGWSDDGHVVLSLQLVDTWTAASIDIVGGGVRTLAARRGTPAWIEGTRVVVVGTLDRGCGVARVAGTATEQLREIPCDANPRLICATGLVRPCVLIVRDAGFDRVLPIDPATLATGEEVYRTPNLWMAGPVWPSLSRDGKLAQPRGTLGLDVVDLATRDVRTYALGDTSLWQGVAWEPDGRHLIAVQQPDLSGGDGRLLRIDLATSEIAVLVARPVAFGAPHVSPDGTHIAVNTLSMAETIELVEVQP